MERAAVSEYLVGKGIANSCRTETVFRFHAELGEGCRINDCEVCIRLFDGQVLVMAVLPVSVMSKEARGVVKYLADLNRERSRERKGGFFDLDYLTGKIYYAERMVVPPDDESLETTIQRCVRELEYESDDLLGLVCDENTAVFQEEMKDKRRKERESRPTGLYGRFIGWLKKNVMDPEPPEYYEFGDAYEPYGDEDDEVEITRDEKPAEEKTDPEKETPGEDAEKEEDDEEIFSILQTLNSWKGESEKDEDIFSWEDGPAEEDEGPAAQGGALTPETDGDETDKKEEDVKKPEQAE